LNFYLKKRISFLKSRLFNFLTGFLKHKKFIRMRLSIRRSWKNFSRESKVFLAIKRNRNGVTMALFVTVLLIPLSSSVNLVGQLGFIDKKLPVETLEGGIILNVTVKDGQFVNKGDLLVSIDEPRLNSELTGQMNATALKACRIERYKSIIELTDFENPSHLELIPEIYLNRYCPQEKKVADGLLSNYKTRIDFIQRQLSQTNADVDRLQIAVGNEGRRLQIQHELYQKRKLLVAQKFYSEAALLEQENQVINAKQSLVDRSIELSDRKNKQIDLHRQILDIRAEFTDKNRSDYAALIAEFEAQYANLQSVYRSTQNLRIVAPQSGYITNLKKIRPGILLAPREQLLEIVPIGEQFVAIAKYKPLDHSNVHVGQNAVVRLQTHNQSFSPEFHGNVILITPDTKQDNPNDPPMYEAVIGFVCDADCRKERFLTAGIPVDVYVLGQRRSLLSYLISAMYKAGRVVLSEPN
jgi:HlyD family type I secretion membrane fusion protein